MPLVYQELRGIARRVFAGERSSHTLQPTAVLHEAYARLVDANVDWSDRAHFYAIAAREMRRVLVDHARRKGAARRGGDFVREPLHDDIPGASAPIDDLLDLDAALTRLREKDEHLAHCVELHYFGGMTWDEMAEVLGVSRSTVARDIRLAKAMIWRDLGDRRSEDK